MATKYFKNYYYLLGVSREATEADIKSALAALEGKRSQSLLYEIRMIMLNNELKKLYDEEFDLFCASGNKPDFEISNEELINFLRSTYTQEQISIDSTVNSLLEEDKRKERLKKILIYFVILLLFFCILKVIVQIIFSATHY